MSHLRASLTFLVLSTLLLGLAYPAASTGLIQLFFSERAHGSLLEKDGKPVGSHLIGQSFTQARYFWGRPSLTEPAYNAAASQGGNWSAANPALQDMVRKRSLLLQNSAKEPIPADLAFPSASGLDPHISVASALYQVPRVAKARRLAEEELIALVRQKAEPRQLIILGEPRVNVLKLNLALDALQPSGSDERRVPAKSRRAP